MTDDNTPDYLNLGAAILKASRKANQEANERNGVGMSQIGSCPRKVWYISRQLPETPRDLDSELTFGLGNLVEEWIITNLKRAGFDVRDEQLDVIYRGITGHIDGMLYIPQISFDPHNPTYTRYVIECKSMGGWGFKNLERVGLQENNPEYYYQLQGYIRATGANGGLIIIANKEATKTDADRLDNPDQVTKLYVEWIVPDGPAIEQKLDEVIAVIEGQEPPARPYPAPVKFPCSYCSYFGHCWGGRAYEAPPKAPRGRKAAAPAGLLEEEVRAALQGTSLYDEEPK